MTSKSVYTRFFALSAVLLCLSCGGDPEPTPPLCWLTKRTSGNLVTTVEYNSNGRASKVTGAYTVTGEEYAVEIEYDGERIVKIINNANSYDEFVYEGGRLKEIRAMQKYGTADFILAITTTLEYDQTGQVVKAVFTGPGLPAYGTLYDRAVKSSGNTSQIFTTSNGTSNGHGPERLKSEVTRFDDKNSIDATFPFTITFAFGQSFLGIYISYRYFQSRNNALEGKTYSSDGTPSAYAATLEYNEQGYPIKFTGGGFTTESEYDCEGD